MSVGAVARATLKVRSTGATARKTADAGHGDGVADVRAAVGVRRASARGCDTAGAVITCLAGGAVPAAPTAAVIATRLARAVRRAARSADTHLARRTRRDTGAARLVALLTLAGIAGSNQADRTTDVSRRAALVGKTGLARGTGSAAPSTAVIAARCVAKPRPNSHRRVAAGEVDAQGTTVSVARTGCCARNAAANTLTA
jgi:hypothetical protein